LLDEPSCGLTTAESAEITARIRAPWYQDHRAHDAHDIRLGFAWPNGVMLLHFGEIACEGHLRRDRNNQCADIYMAPPSADPGVGDDSSLDDIHHLVR